MTRLLSLAAITTTVSLGLLFAACSGASGVTIPDASTTTTNDSGNSSGGLDGDSGPVDDSGIVCGPCETAKPSPSCTTVDPCGCGPYTCPDGGSTNDCTWSATNTCGAGKYCNAPGCGKGTCVAVPTTETVANNPRCGCDGVTYWNATVAASHGMAVSKNAACTGGNAIACSAVTACPTGASCNLEKGKLEDCADGKAGQCWVLPTTCPVAAVIGKDAKACGMAACIGECAAIKAGTAWYTEQCPLLPPGH